MKWRLPPTCSGWSWNQLVRVAGGVLLLELILVFSLSRPASPLRAPEAFPGALVWHGEESDFVLSQWLPDPVVFARVVAQGFSGPLWLSAQAIDSVKGTPVHQGLRTSAKFPQSLRPKLDEVAPTEPRDPGPRLTAMWFAPEPSPRTWRAPQSFGLERSFFRLGEGLIGWQIELNETPPVWTNAHLLAPTVVQVLVNPQGLLLSATLEPPGSGLPAADQEALRLVRQARFVAPPDRPLSSPLHWGRVELVWHTVAPVPESPPSRP
jgi:TonB family protein